MALIDYFYNQTAAGVMGGATADTLVKMGYSVSAWTRRPRTHPGVRCFHGREQLQEFAAQVDVLVCLLPLTAHTRGILCKELFSCMRRGAAVINVARGSHLVEEDLVEALDCGQVSVRCCVLQALYPQPTAE